MINPRAGPFAILGSWVSDVCVSSVFSQEARAIADTVLRGPGFQHTLSPRLCGQPGGIKVTAKDD